MKRMSIRLFLLFILLVFLQVWLFNNIHLFGLATPLLYVYFLIKLPISMNRNSVLFLSALMGLIIDIFGGAWGLNMLATVTTGFLHYYLLKLFAPRDTFDDYNPSFDTFGKLLFMRYAGTMTFIHVSLLYLIESFSLFNLGLLTLRIAGSFFLTILLVFAFETIKLETSKR